MKTLIVGCGISGVSLARLLADKGQAVTIIDQRNTSSGNCFDYFDHNGICIHKYGTHIFHTDKEPVWDFLSRFTQWFPYQHKVLGLIDGQLVPIPFNLISIEAIFPKKLAECLTDKLIEHFGLGTKVPILALRKTGDKDLQYLADYVYEKVFLHYTLKQWGLTPEQLDPAVTGRVPVFVGRDCRYFQNRFQGIPLLGYTAMIEKMLDHPSITVKLATPFEHQMEASFDRIFYSGPIDEYFDFALGELPYRSLHFDFIEFDRPFFQKNSVVNYPCNYNFTRIGEYKYFLDTQSAKTVVSYEYPRAFVRGENERYYPIVNDANKALYARYQDLAAKAEKVTFFGRLGDYKYYDMDNAVERVLELAATY